MLNEYRAADLEPEDVLLLLTILALFGVAMIGLVWVVIWLALRLLRP